MAGVAAIPRTLWPAAIGAVLLGGIVTIRFIVVSLIFFNQTRSVGEALSGLAWGCSAIIAAAASGAAGGLAVPMTRPVLRRLGTIGDYLTGVVVVEAYAWALVGLAPIAFGESMLQHSTDWMFIAGYAAFLGLLGGYMYRRNVQEQSTASTA